GGKHERFDDDRRCARGAEHLADIDIVERLEVQAVERGYRAIVPELVLDVNANEPADVGVANKDDGTAWMVLGDGADQSAGERIEAREGRAAPPAYEHRDRFLGLVQLHVAQGVANGAENLGAVQRLAV